MIRGIQTALVLAATTLLLAGCGDTSWEMLNKTEWVLETLHDQPVPEEAPPITLSFDGQGRISGSSGCNNYTAKYTYTVKEQSFLVKSIARTFRLCNPNELMEFEGEFLTALQDAATYRLEDGLLELYSADGVPLLIFEEEGIFF